MKMPILTKGEKMSEIISKRNIFPDNEEFPRPYEIAQKEIVTNLKEIKKDILEKKENVEEEFIVTIRMFKKYTAKSYIPEQIVNKNKSKIVGARNFTNANKELAKLYFLKTNLEEIEELENKLQSVTVTKEFQKQL